MAADRLTDTEIVQAHAAAGKPLAALPPRVYRLDRPVVLTARDSAELSKE